MKIRTLVLAVSVAAGGFAATNVAHEVRRDWENPAVNSLNRLPARTYAMPLKDVAAALTDDLEPQTPYKLSLNGTWKISWTGDPALREKDFWRTDFDDSRWFSVKVPGCVELQGFGTPGYTNVRYPHALAYPRILDRDTEKGDYNPVSSYRRTFTVPPEWKGRRVILRFDGVYSAYYVWVNGHKVGYAEDSKLPSEFDITSYLNPTTNYQLPATNLLAVQAFRWCDGSYLEDQDMFRFSGIFRDVTLWSMPKDGVWDFCVKTTPVDGYEKWKLEVKVEGEKSKSKVEVEDRMSVSLYDAEHRKIGDLHSSTSTSNFDLTLKPRLWSAEDPYLYTLVIRRGDDIRSRRIGFKEQKIVGNTFLVNGRPVKFKGVNRHEASPTGGRTVTLDEMIRDVTLMKRYNINCVRTSHYPDHRLWYDLCDRYGIYLVAEANVEGHEAWCEGKKFGEMPEWTPSIVERNERQALFYRNHPSVTMWSTGNETGHGDGFRAAIAAVKKVDPTRPVHWQVGCQDADIDGWMYPTVEWLENRGKLGDNLPGGEKAHRDEYGTDTHQTAGKCFFLCEYAHAMGTALGNFQEYWDVYNRYDSLCGGCVWDWIDQALWKTTDRIDPKTGRARRYFAYGGDWDEFPNDGPFCCNGLIGPDREPTSKLREVAHVHRNLVVVEKVKGEGQGQQRNVLSFEILNRFSFTRADEFEGRAELVVDGEVVETRPFAVPPVAPLSRGRLELPRFKSDKKGERFVNISFALKNDTIWAKKGWVTARDQLPLFKGEAESFPLHEKSSLHISESPAALTVSAGATTAVFSRRTGTLSLLEMGGRTILRDGVDDLVAGPRLTCLRAFTDNDRWMRDGDDFSENRKVGSCYSRGLTQLSYHARPIIVTNGVVRTAVAVTGAKSAGFEHEADWSFGADGSVTVANRVIPHGTMPPALPRLGLSLVLDPALERMEWYGRGPHENYVDRSTSAFVGRWRSTVTDQYEGAVRPQDCGYKTDVRWVTFTDGTGCGVRFSASEQLFVQALHYTREDLEFARHRNGMSRFRCPLEPRPEVMLNLDVRQTGLGGASCGPRPLAKYRFPIEPTVWELRLAPVVAAPCPASDEKPVDIRTGRQLLVDDFVVSCVSNVVRHWNRPVKEPDPVLWPGDGAGRGVRGGGTNANLTCATDGGLWWDPTRGKYRLWYQGDWLGDICYAESADGRTWTYPDLGVVKGTSRVFTNDVIDSWCVLPDYTAANPYAAWKMYISEPGGLTDDVLFESTDGLRFRRLGAAGQSGDRSMMYFDPFRGKWIFSLRDGWPVRRRRFFESATFGGADCRWRWNWGRTASLDAPTPEDWLMATNKPNWQLYNFDAVAYESLMLGVMEVLYNTPNDNTDCEKVGLPKQTGLHFCFSRDGKTYVPRDEADIAPSGWGSGAWDSGYLSAVGGICTVDDDRLTFYYSGLRGDGLRLIRGSDPKDWSRNGMYSNGALGRATLRRDGFAGMVSDAQGELVTKPLVFTGAHLFVNAECRFGSVEAEVVGKDGRPVPGFAFADCTPIRSRDATKAELVFRGGSLARFGTQGVRLRFRLHCATLYSFWLSLTARGESNGYVAAGGPSYPGLRDTAKDQPKR